MIKNIVFDCIHHCIEQYEKVVDEKPYIILVSPTLYIILEKYSEETNAWKYLSKMKNGNDKINYIFGVPIEVSKYIIQEAICLNKHDYEEYCILKLKMEDL